MPGDVASATLMMPAAAYASAIISCAERFDYAASRRIR